MRSLALALALALAATGARAAVAEQHETGFTIRNTVEVATTPARAYAALGEIGRWWSDEHTYSGKAINLTLPLAANACFCETWAGGSVRHGVVEITMPGQMLRLDSALGPLQGEGVSGALTWEIKAKGQAVEVIQAFKSGGFSPAAAKAWSGPVDQVLKEGLERYKRYVETGKP